METAEATGTVRFQGSPVAGAIVVFVPKSDTPSSVTYSAETDEAGIFQLRTPTGPGEFQKGVPPGEYLVSVSKMNTAELTQMTQRPKDMFPEKFTDPTKSGLTATVVAGQKNDFPFDVPAGH